MSTKGHIYYDNLSEIYTDSTDRSVNILIDVTVIVRFGLTDSALEIETKSGYVLPSISIPIGDIKGFDYDVNGLFIEMDEDTATAKIVRAKQIEKLKPC